VGKGNRFGAKRVNASQSDLKGLRADPGAAGADSGAEVPADRIFVRDLVLPIAIGAYAEEQGILQNVAFSVEAEVLPHVKAVDDDIQSVPSYDDIVKAIAAIVAAGHINLTETLAERVAAACLREPRIERVKVRIEKLDRGPAAVGVEIVRRRPLAPLG
jgi:7,8-dihydroneopterin aldolase/epimerase/oxygenase